MKFQHLKISEVSVFVCPTAKRQQKRKDRPKLSYGTRKNPQLQPIEWGRDHQWKTSWIRHLKARRNWSRSNIVTANTRSTDSEMHTLSLFLHNRFHTCALFRVALPPWHICSDFSRFSLTKSVEAAQIRVDIFGMEYNLYWRTQIRVDILGMEYNLTHETYTDKRWYTWHGV